MIANNGPLGFRIKVVLEGIDPCIWRRFCVPTDISLGELHQLLQIVMGWNNCHLHEFRFQEQRIGPLDFDEVYEELIDEEEVFLENLFTKAGIQLTYVYDMGDDWVHTLTYEGPLQPGDTPLTALEGARACPPEDCGGMWGYANLLEVQADPRHPEHQEMLEWLDGPFDPEDFSLDDINDGLACWQEVQKEFYEDLEDMDTMLEVDYDAEVPVDPEQWLELDEAERMMAIQLYHEIHEEELPNATLHAVIHCIVENQLAEGVTETHETLKRLMSQGLERHDAIHAIGSAVAQHLFKSLSGTAPTDSQTINLAYFKSLKQLNAQEWLAQFEQDDPTGE